MMIFGTSSRKAMSSKILIKSLLLRDDWSNLMVGLRMSYAIISQSRISFNTEDWKLQWKYRINLRKWMRVSPPRNTRIDTLWNLFNYFNIIGRERVQDTYDRLCDLSSELQGLGVEQITDHEVVKKLLHFRDNYFDTLVLMIKKCPN